MSVVKAEDTCADAGGHLFYPETSEELSCVTDILGYTNLSKGCINFIQLSLFRNGESNFLIGIRNYRAEYQNIIAMDYSRQIGFRPFTRKTDVETQN